MLGIYTCICIMEAGDWHLLKQLTFVSETPRHLLFLITREIHL